METINWKLTKEAREALGEAADYAEIQGIFIRSTSVVLVPDLDSTPDGVVDRMMMRYGRSSPLGRWQVPYWEIPASDLE